MKCAMCACVCVCAFYCCLCLLSFAVCLCFLGLLQVCFDNARRIMGLAPMLRHEMSWSRGVAPPQRCLGVGWGTVGPRLMSLAKSQIAVHELFMFMQMSPVQQEHCRRHRLVRRCRLVVGAWSMEDAAGRLMGRIRNVL